jgi:hypothetical protein
MHAMPGCTHMPQLALQHSSPGAQVFLPQATPVLSGTHCAWAGQGARMHCTGLSAQWYPARQRTVAQVGSAKHCGLPLISSQ